MNFIKVDSYEKLSITAANIIASQIIMKPNCVLGLATGSSPVGTYKELIKKCNAGELDFSTVTSVNLDEYVGLNGDHDQSYRYFMNTNLFNHVNIDKARTAVPSGISDDLDAEGAAYDKHIADLGGIDLQLLGIGHNGHIGFNEPADVFPKLTNCVDLTESTINANARFFASIEDVPTQAYTMGIQTIMNAKKILLVANGAGKAEILKKSFFGDITPQVPASVLQLHPDVTVVGDEEAFALIKDLI